MSIFAPEGGWREYLCRWKTGERDKNILVAFRATEQAVRLLLARYGKEGMTLLQACELADYIREQRELIKQVLQNKQPRRARLLARKRRRLRTELLERTHRAGLDVQMVQGRCEIWSGPAVPH
jgi:hypothetical protein